MRPQAAQVRNPAALRPGAIPTPTPVLNIAGYELQGNYRRISNNEAIDQKRYDEAESRTTEAGALPWITIAYEDEEVNDPEFHHVHDWDTWVRYCDTTAASTIPRVLNILAKRESLAIAASMDSRLAEALKTYGVEAKKKHPSIYVRQIVVGPGKHNLTVKQAEDIARFIRQYASALPQNADAAYRIDKKLFDKWERAWTDDGARRLTHDVNQVKHKVKTRILQTFGSTLEKAAEEAKAEGHTNIRTMYYVGYARDAASRAEQHNKMDENTNGLFNLVYHLLQDWNPGVEVRIETFPVCLLINAQSAAVAEMFICRIAGGYFYAGGFNRTQCGSVDSALKLPEGEWEKLREDLDKAISYVQRMKDELKKRQAYQRKEFDDQARELNAEEQKYRNALKKVRVEHSFLEKSLDLEYMKSNEFLREFVADWETVDNFVKNIPEVHSTVSRRVQHLRAQLTFAASLSV